MVGIHLIHFLFFFVYVFFRGVFCVPVISLCVHFLFACVLWQNNLWFVILSLHLLSTNSHEHTNINTHRHTHKHKQCSCWFSWLAFTQKKTLCQCLHLNNAIATLTLLIAKFCKNHLMQFNNYIQISMSFCSHICIWVSSMESAKVVSLSLSFGINSDGHFRLYEICKYYNKFVHTYTLRAKER